MTVELASSVPERRKANKAEAAEWFGVSIPSIDAWLRRGCPYVQRGERGKQWVLDLLAVSEWRFSGATESTEDDPEKMSPKDRLDWYRGARERTKHLEECGELMRASDFETALASAIKTIAVTLESLPDVMERDAGLDGAAVERCQIVVDRMREDLHKRLTGASADA